MTLHEILDRLERIEQIQAYCLRCDEPATDDDKQHAIAELRLDIERHLINEGKL